MPILDEYFPFDLGHGYPANTARWRKMANLWQSDGVVASYPYGAATTASQLYATLAGTTVTVQPGAVFVHGYYGEVQNSQAITGVGTNGTVVAGVDLVSQNISIYYRDGVLDYGSNPATNYEQDTSKWEIPLWLVSPSGLIDLRTILSPGAGCGWWNSLNSQVSVGANGTTYNTVLTPRVPYVGNAMMRGELLLTFTDASQAQNAICRLVYQSGQSDMQMGTGPGITPAIPGGGPVGGYLSVPVTSSTLIPVSQGKKIVGWQVTAGPGPAVIVQQFTAALQIVNLPTSG